MAVHLGAAKMAVHLGATGYQLSTEWIEITVLSKLPDGDLAGQAVSNALNGHATLKTAVAGLDKITGEFKIIKVDAP
jgi:hypothetical protein